MLVGAGEGFGGVRGYKSRKRWATALERQKKGGGEQWQRQGTCSHKASWMVQLRLTLDHKVVRASDLQLSQSPDAQRDTCAPDCTIENWLLPHSQCSIIQLYIVVESLLRLFMSSVSPLESVGQCQIGLFRTFSLSGFSGKEQRVCCFLLSAAVCCASV